MPRDAHEEHREQRLHPAARGKEAEYAVEHRAPQQCQGVDFGAQRNGSVLAEITDVGPQLAMSQQPCIKPFGGAQPEGCREQQKGCGGEKRQEDADDAQRKAQCP